MQVDIIIPGIGDQFSDGAKLRRENWICRTEPKEGLDAITNKCAEAAGFCFAIWSIRTPLLESRGDPRHTKSVPIA